MPTEKIEIGFDISGNPDAPFVTLDDPVKGILGSAEYVIGGTIYQDVTDDVIAYSITRGKSRQLDRYPAGRASIELRNEDRKYDPIYSGSPYAGQIIPRRPVRISTNATVQYIGTIDDWDLSYSLDGHSTASVVCSDGLIGLANQTLGSAVQTVELSGARINKVLNNTNVNWPANNRNLDVGRTELQADTIEAGQNALQYIQQITRTEPGVFYIDKNGQATFRDRYSARINGSVISFSDDGSGIPYRTMEVVYGSELLYNEIEIQQKSGVTVVARDAQSQEEYGILNLTLDNLLMNTAENAANLAVFLANKYSIPEYRFESLGVILEKLEASQVTDILGLELGDVVEVSFTPNGVGDAITKNVEVISIAHRVTTDQHLVEFKFGTLESGLWRLSDPVFGKLSSGNALAY